MNTASLDPSSTLLANLPSLLPKLEALYKDVHAHPELSMQENRTADLAVKHLRDNGYELTTGVGKTGVVGLLRNGEGPTVMLRAETWMRCPSGKPAASIMRAPSWPQMPREVQCRWRMPAAMTCMWHG